MTAMNLLALETATESCSAALLVEGRLFVRSEIAPRRHAELLLPMCAELLAEAGIARRDLEALAVGAGPGAFTGVRLAISAAQGIALALDIPVIPVSSLAALAMQAPANGATILAVIDARMGEIYAGAFRRTPEGLVEPIDMESVGAANALRIPVELTWNIVGSGWGTYADAIRAHLTAEPVWADGARYPQAADVALIAAPIARAGLGVSPELALPVYLRDKVALTVTEQQAQRARTRTAG
jgi:tRNA threonylcarbamoyladenosine biosynthesis protein TsaB